MRGVREGSFRFDSYDTAVRELLALGPDVDVMLPVEMRVRMVEVGRRIAERHEHHIPDQADGQKVQKLDPPSFGLPGEPADLTRREAPPGGRAG